MNIKTEDPWQILEGGPSDFDLCEQTPRSDFWRCDFNKQQGTSNHSPKCAGFEFGDGLAEA